MWSGWKLFSALLALLTVGEGATGATASLVLMWLRSSKNILYTADVD